MNRNGFTLIELLVVISIIGMLSSIILTNLQSTRVKASNQSVNTVVGQYLRSVNSYFNDFGYYPQLPPDSSNPSLVSNISYYIGTYPAGTVTPEPSLNSALAPYYPGLPSLPLMTYKNNCFLGTISVYGPKYYCTRVSTNGPCVVPTEYNVSWTLNGSSESCPFGAVRSNLCTLTSCVYTFK